MTHKNEKKPAKKLSQYKQAELPIPFIFPEPEKDYSNTIELYDAIPKYQWGKVERIDGRFLESLDRSFEFRAKVYQVKITPARIGDKQGKDREYYPGKREELVEDALRKLACDGQGIYLDDQAGVLFSLNELKNELSRLEHTYSLDELKTAILILSGTNMTLEDAKGQILFNSTLFDSVGLQTRKNRSGAGERTKCFVRFNTLVTRSIRAKTFRMSNYKRIMGYKHNLARWLEKRMAHLFTQAGLTTLYHINLSTIVRDSGMKEYRRLRGNLEKVRMAIAELKGKQVVARCDEKKVIENRKIIDVKFIIKPGIRFVQDVKKANAKLVGLSGGSKNQ